MQPVQPPEHDRSPSISGRSARLSAARYGLGGVMVLAAVVVLVVIPGDIGFTSAMAYGVGSALAAGLSVLLIKAVVSVVLLRLLYRWSVNRDRTCTALVAIASRVYVADGNSRGARLTNKWVVLRCQNAGRTHWYGPVSFATLMNMFEAISRWETKAVRCRRTTRRPTRRHTLGRGSSPDHSRWLCGVAADTSPRSPASASPWRITNLV